MPLRAGTRPMRKKILVAHTSDATHAERNLVKWFWTIRATAKTTLANAVLGHDLHAEPV